MPVKASTFDSAGNRTPIQFGGINPAPLSNPRPNTADFSKHTFKYSGPAYQQPDGSWYRPTNYNGKQPQAYLDYMAERQNQYTQDRMRYYQEKEAERKAAAEKRQRDIDYRTGVTKQETDHRYGGQKAYPMPQIEDDYERMGAPDYSYNNDAPNQNANAGDLSATYDRNTAGLLSGLLGDGLSPDGARGIADLQRGLAADAKSEIEQDAQARNAQGGVGGNQLEQEGLAQQAQLYGQINDRAQSQMGLAQQMQSSRMQDHMAQMKTWAANQKKHWGLSNRNFFEADYSMRNMFDQMFRQGLFSTQVADPYGGPE